MKNLLSSDNWIHGETPSGFSPCLLQNWLVILPQFFTNMSGRWVFYNRKCVRKTKFPDFLQWWKHHFSPVLKICFWPHPQTVNLGTSRPGSFVAPVKTYTTVKKKFWKNTVVSEKIGLKGFSLGQFVPKRGEAVEKKNCLVYGSKSTTRPWLVSVNFLKKFSSVLRFFALLMTSLILGGSEGTKNRIGFVDFQSECYVKISSTGNDV